MKKILVLLVLLFFMGCGVSCSNKGIHKMTRRFMKRLIVYPVKGEPEIFEGEYQWAEGLHFLRIQSIVNNVKTTRLFPYQDIQNIKVMDVPEEE